MTFRTRWIGPFFFAAAGVQNMVERTIRLMRLPPYCPTFPMLPDSFASEHGAEIKKFLTEPQSPDPLVALTQYMRAQAAYFRSLGEERVAAMCEFNESHLSRTIDALSVVDLNDSDLDSVTRAVRRRLAAQAVLSERQERSADVPQNSPTAPSAPPVRRRT